MDSHGHDSLITAPTGALTTQAALDAHAGSFPHDEGVTEVAPGVFAMSGYSLTTGAFIVGNGGVIVIDAGETMELGETYLGVIRSITDLPIVALIYTHSHYVNGAGAFIEDGVEPAVYGHHRLNANMASGGVGCRYPELAPLLSGRSVQQYPIMTPKEGPDSAYAEGYEMGRRHFLPVGHPVEHDSSATIAGVRFEFFAAGESDTDDGVSIWLPDQRVLVSNLLWSFLPNIFTPRGALYRDPESWLAGLEFERDLDPDVVIGVSSLSVLDREAVAHQFAIHIDALRFLHDQTLRALLRGVRLDELADHVQLPEELASEPTLSEAYGLFAWYPEHIAVNAIGPFSGDAVELFHLDPNEESRRLIDLIGGRQRVLDEARTAFESGEWEWGARLADHVYRLDPLDAEARAVKADCLRQLGYHTPSTLARGWALNQALSLEGAISVPRVLPPPVEQVVADPIESVKSLRVRLDPEKAQGIDRTLLVTFSDLADDVMTTVAIHVRRGVCHVTADLRPGASALAITLSTTQWASIVRSRASVADLASTDAVAQPDTDAVDEFLAMFDRWDRSLGAQIPATG